MIKDNFKKEYKRKTIAVGDQITLPAFEIQKFEGELAKVLFKDKNLVFYLGLNFPALGFGPFGTKGYMLPEHLPYSHTGFVMSRNSYNMVSHRSSNEEIQLKFDRDFHLNGAYCLMPKQGDVLYYTSDPWEKHPRLIKTMMEGLKGKTLKDVKGTVYRVMNHDSGQTHKALLLSSITSAKKDSYTVFLLFEESVIYGFPGNLLLEF
jgi:hypothetical protein